MSRPQPTNTGPMVGQRIKSAFVEVKGKLVEGTPKTHQVRIVPLPRFLVDELAAHVEGMGPDELVFSTPAGAPLRNTNFRRRHWDKAVTTAGLTGLPRTTYGTPPRASPWRPART